jgi:ubiquinone/menaquinone biosynthesis C-methylase UbiE
MKTKKNHPYLFQIIAPIYGWFYNYQKRNYKKEINIMKNASILENCKTILDVGCGTGALSSAFTEFGYSVTGIDPVLGMLKIAKRKAKQQNIIYNLGNILDGLDIEDNKFDVSVASYVAHGLKKQDRMVMYKEMKRVSKEKVLFFEYNQNRNLLITIVEYLEGGDYFNFIKEVNSELEQIFNSVKVLARNGHGSLYICEI